MTSKATPAETVRALLEEALSKDDANGNATDQGVEIHIKVPCTVAIALLRTLIASQAPR